MTIALRQICLVARELKPAINDLTGVFGITSCFIDPAVASFGLENTLLAVGSNFLEVVAPVEDNTAADRYLDRRQGDGGYMVICQADSKDTQQQLKARAQTQGVRVAFEAERETWNICQLHPGDMQAAFFEVDWDQNNDFTGNWHPAGGMGWQHKVRQDVTVAFQGIELQGPDPLALATRWSEVADIPLMTSDGNLSLALDNAQLRFVEAQDGRGPGLGGIDLAVADLDRVLHEAEKRGCRVNDNRVDVCGTRFYLQAADA